MQNAAFLMWLALRIARYVAWVAFLIYSFLVLWDKSSYVDNFGKPLRSTEVWLYLLPVLAVTFGLLELMMRERAGLRRPDYFRLMPPQGPPETTRHR